MILQGFGFSSGASGICRRSPILRQPFANQALSPSPTVAPSASRISSVEIVRPPTVIGRNTVHCLQSGMLFGYAGLIDAMVPRLREELDPDAEVLATGGLAHVIAAETESITRVEPFLTLRGLRLIYERNRGEYP